jgi:AraC-like DNA-binding protein
MLAGVDAGDERPAGVDLLAGRPVLRVPRATIQHVMLCGPLPMGLPQVFGESGIEAAVPGVDVDFLHRHLGAKIENEPALFAVGEIERACEGLSVNEVLKVVPISRSTLERSCRRWLGRSPNEEIVRVRIERVCNLLRDTDLSLDQIAARTGFTTSQYMLEVFRKTIGVTPGNYRRSLISGER